MRDFIVRDIIEITGRFPLSEKERYVEYSLKSVVSNLGFATPSIFIDVDSVDYKYLKKRFRYMVANVYIKLNEEQKARFNTDKERILCNIRARYKGDDDNWAKAAYSWVDDIVIRYGENLKNIPYPITFSYFTIMGRLHQLHGERLDWTRFESQEAWAERKEPQMGYEYNEYECEGEYTEYIDEREGLLLDAFEDNIDQWNCR